MMRGWLWAIAAAVSLGALVLIGAHWRGGPQGLSLTLASPAAGTSMPKAMPESMAPEEGTAVRVNSATAEELCELRGIGPSLAQAIVEEREANGAFYYPEDLLNVRGIGRQKLKDMAGQLIFDTPSGR